MAGRLTLFSLAAILCCFGLAAVWGADPPQVAEQLIMLRNGEILHGHVTRQDDHYQVSIADGELRLRVSDVDLICQTLEEAYQARRARLTLGRAEDHLDLADWCLRQGLPGDAARELSAVLALDPTNPRIGLLDRRLQESLAPRSVPTAARVAVERRVTDEDLDRMLRALPSPAIESFTTSIQPLLVSSCATAGCHSSSNKGNFTLIRVPADRFGSRRLTQRNLQSTLSLLDFQNPQQSRLLAVVGQPHATVRSAVFDPQGSKYRELLIWIGMVTQKPLFEPEIASQPPTIRPAGVNPALPDSFGSNPAFGGSPAPTAGGMWPSDEFPATAAADTDTRPIRPSHRMGPVKPLPTRPDGRAAYPARSPSALPSSALPPAAQPPAAQPPAAQPSAAQQIAPTSGSDPYDAEAFNRQFANAARSQSPPVPLPVPLPVVGSAR